MKFAYLLHYFHGQYYSEYGWLGFGYRNGLDAISPIMSTGRRLFLCRSDLLEVWRVVSGWGILEVPSLLSTFAGDWRNVCKLGMIPKE